jgi:hypothetical protein
MKVIQFGAKAYKCTSLQIISKVWCAWSGLCPAIPGNFTGKPKQYAMELHRPAKTICHGTSLASQNIMPGNFTDQPEAYAR